MDESETGKIDPTVVARVVHEAIRAYRKALGEEELPPWDAATASMRESSLAAVRYRLATPGASPAAQHAKWLAAKTRAGWRFGERRDDEARQHPSMVPYEALPASERRKDALVQAIVDAFVRTL